MVDPEEDGYGDWPDEGNGRRNTIEPQLEEKRLAERQAIWDSLLEARLQSTESITDWVERVLDVSDLGYDCDERSSQHPSSIEWRAASTNQMPQEGSDEGSEQETGEHTSNERNSSPDDMDSEINQHNATPETSDRQMMNVDSAVKTKVELSHESRTTGATNMQTDDRGQFDDASTSSDDSVDLRDNKHYTASNSV